MLLATEGATGYPETMRTGLLLGNVDVLLKGASWVRNEVLGGNEAYKSCRVCGKRIIGLSRIWRKRCDMCGHRTCPQHLNGRTCRSCLDHGPPGSVKALSSRLESKLERLKHLHEKGLIDDKAYQQGKNALIEAFTKDP